MFLHIMIFESLSDNFKRGIGMRKSFLSFVIVLSFLAVAVASASDKGESLTAGKCSTCHKTAKFCKFLGVKNAAWWGKVVDGMIKKGAKINGDEKKIIVDYLAMQPKGSKPVCN